MAAASLSLYSSAASAAEFPCQEHHRIPPPRAAALRRLPPPLRPRPRPRPYRSMLLARAKFEKFDGADPPFSAPASASAEEEEEDPAAPPDPAKEADEDDSCLPSDLEGAIRQSGESSAMFIASGGMRAIVELLIPQLLFLNTEGAQAEVWELSRIFLETLIEESGFLRVKAIFPDSGVAALLKYQWKDTKFGCSRYLSDKKKLKKKMKAIVAITAIIAGGRLFLRPIYKQIAENQNAEIFSANTLLVILGTSLLTAWRVSGEAESTSTSETSETAESSEQSKRPLKKALVTEVCCYKFQSFIEIDHCNLG